ncbi:geranylgeranyl pyrophosphate synthetase [Aspergillus vadensis CBS 113365]|uniref:Geranylgeranyl pyrophosphate synthetase n=1 Tax=Aspergillus vadensis (strain CBS 113365 / IMI 142717 / IBT 24658) TaxID=1448311 RepID=A0A319BMU7_ASPVC|nr:geranylgeranyl pyrophosphate synthetase [Aspergillus vadensis CBS 113365]PYH64568.1 geranylgeranyl pyrophosphate synthetase [Aspergillus vadensis CBS 113365]
MWRAPSGLYLPKPHGARRGWSGARQPGNRQDSVAESPVPPYSPLLLEIDNTKLKRSKECPQIISCKYSPVTEGCQLKPDRGEYFHDPNTARYPSYPRQSPDYNITNINIVTCSSTFGNLVRFARGMDKDFRFIIETAGDSIYFIRRKNSPNDLILNVHGYGHIFLDENTTWGPGLAGSELYQQIIKYTFGGLDLLLRFESDSYIPKQSPEMSSSNLHASRGILTGDIDSDINSLIARLQEDHSPDPVKDPGKLTIQEAGRRVDQRDIINIKTRSMVDFKTKAIKKKINITDLTPHLWVSQIPILIIAYHNRGLFEEIRVQDMRDKIIQWKQENEEMLRRAAWLLHELVHYTKSSITRLEVCRSGAGPIQIQQVTGDSPMALAPEMKAKLTGRVSPDVSNHRCISSRGDNFSDRRLGFDSSDPESESDARD